MRPWPGPPDQSRFAVVYHFYSTARKHRLRLVVPVEEDAAAVDSLTSLWPGANWLEREVWDMFGIRFRRPSGPAAHTHVRGVSRVTPCARTIPIKKRQPLIGPKASSAYGRRR